MKLQVFHRTRHLYAGSVRESFNETRLQPPDTEGQRRHSFILKVLPSSRLRHYLDFYLNCVHVFEVAEPHNELTVEATSIVTTSEQPLLPDDGQLAPLSSMDACLRMERCYDFLQPTHYVAMSSEVRYFAEDEMIDTDAWQLALSLMRKVHREISYEPLSTNVHTTTADVMRLRTPGPTWIFRGRRLSSSRWRPAGPPAGRGAGGGRSAGAGRRS